MIRVTNKTVAHSICSFAFRVLVSLKMSFKILMISLYIWTIASIRSRHLDGNLRGRDKISTLNLFKYIFIEHDILILAPTYKNLIYPFHFFLIKQKYSFTR